jgi:hypothetical protein
LTQRLLGHLHADRVVVRSAVAAAQDEVAVTVAARAHDRRASLAVDAQETVRPRGREDGVDGDADVAVGAVLEADRGRQAGRYLAVRLRFGRARADGRPGDQIAEILRRDRVERLGAGRQAEFGELQQECARLVHALIDPEGIVHVRVIDVALPAGRRARLFEIDPHHQVQRLADLVGQSLQAAA